MLPTALKYAAGAVLMASVFYLVITHVADVGVYIGLVSSAFAAIGIHATIASTKP